MAKLIEKNNYYLVVMESKVEDITIKIDDYVKDLDGLNVICDETDIKCIKEDLRSIIDKVETVIEKEVDKINEMYLEATDEDRIKIVSDLSYLVRDDDCNIKYYIDLFMNRNKLEYIDNNF